AAAVLYRGRRDAETRHPRVGEASTNSALRAGPSSFEKSVCQESCAGNQAGVLPAIRTGCCASIGGARRSIKPFVARVRFPATKVLRLHWAPGLSIPTRGIARPVHADEELL